MWKWELFVCFFVKYTSLMAQEYSRVSFFTGVCVLMFFNYKTHMPTTWVKGVCAMFGRSYAPISQDIISNYNHDRSVNRNEAIT